MAQQELYERMLAVALEEARYGLVEGGIPIGAALFRRSGELVSRGHNRRVQQGDPSVHAETDAFRRAGRQRSYRDMVMVTTLAPCWYAVGWCGSSASARWWWARAAPLPAVSTGCAKTASR